MNVKIYELNVEYKIRIQDRSRTKRIIDNDFTENK